MDRAGEKTEELSKNLNEKMENFEKDMEEKKKKKERDDEVRILLDDMIRKVAVQEYLQKEEKLNKRLDELEVKEVMNHLVNQVAIDNMDKKFEQSAFDIVNNMSHYVGKVNDTSAK
mmetsp:Transcript_3485/g.3437  ORF Transcript_3485/g.3437 Transcript_3485/m.3437 type:complete len:116 (-) Transcript_3485:279-626(-)|eukprot:CAMPEP_0170567284 /NCGR_PEP_ID=MMETSP0211-20121228/80381_1 /TAXON_ID=311385 /ORGANISM="Pseudokeronopsis sp., Strain OXSARD2" /LENGTH=115 /DNA_ID=CAMNT_0010888697 /DNA_START=867 /DNA_END=1214 /DNA_ORIENTATION=-